MSPRLLCISNGHGEDTIALRILEAVRACQPHLEIAALPLVGEGTAFLRADIPLIAATKRLPSGGFIYMDGRQLVRDLQGGLVGLTWTQLQALKTWARASGTILAVGDIVPAVFAWWSGLPYAIVGTAKSAYYLQDEQGRLPDLPWYSGWAGSIYLPWERWLMARDRCRLVIVRDDLTAQELRQLGVGRVMTGNPMMDGFTLGTPPAQLRSPHAAALTLVLLPGSRPPEAYENWDLILTGLDSVLRQFAPRPVHALGAIAPALDLGELRQRLIQQGWVAVAGTADRFERMGALLVLTQTAYGECLQLADAAIALAGTATEQFVGLGKPAFIIPGKGPQFTASFAQLQTRLLGMSVCLVPDPQQVGSVMATVLSDRDRLEAIRQNGQRRMGPPGAAAAIAAQLTEAFAWDGPSA